MDNNQILELCQELGCGVFSKRKVLLALEKVAGIPKKRGRVIVDRFVKEGVLSEVYPGRENTTYRLNN